MPVSVVKNGSQECAGSNPQHGHHDDRHAFTRDRLHFSGDQIRPGCDERDERYGFENGTHNPYLITTALQGKM